MPHCLFWLVAFLACFLASASMSAAAVSGDGGVHSIRAVVATDGLCSIVSRPKPVPTGNQVLVRIHYSAVNRADTLQRKGTYPVPPGESDVLGLEMTGIVEARGPACTLRLEVGSAVMALLGSGGYSDYALVDERLLIRVPDTLGLEQAAAIPETWLTAFQLLHTIAQVKAGDVVLIHASGSGVGVAAIQLAVSMGATVIAVAGADAKLDNAKRLGAAAVANYNNVDFAEVVKEYTRGAGATVILDCVGASFFHKNADAAAVDARWVLYGTMGGAAIEGPVLSSILRKRIRLEGTLLRNRSLEYKIRLTNDFADYSISKFADGTFKPVVDRVFPLDDVQAAHEYMESNQNIGKILLKMA